MGQITCAVMVGFVALHVAAILGIIAFSTPEWSTGNPAQNGTSPANTTTNGSVAFEHRKGLWEFCYQVKNCTKLDDSRQPGWFKAVQGTDTAGVALSLVALIVTYTMLLSQTCKNSSKAAYFSFFMQLVSSACLLIALAVFGKKALKEDTSGDYPLGYDLDYGWSFFVNIAACVLMWLSTFMTLRMATFFGRRQAGYEDI